MTTFGSSDFGSHSLLHQILLYFWQKINIPQIIDDD
jgi:hypothetical protein